MNQLAEECRQEFLAPKYALIHGKFPFYAFGRPTDEIRRFAVQPTAAEAEVLRDVSVLVVRCKQEAYAAQEVRPPPPQELMLYGLATDPVVGGLALLMTRQITYAQYAAILDSQFVEVASLPAPMVEPPANLNLVCVIQSQDQFNGTEFEYSIDLRTNAINASAGPGTPQEVQITPNEISFNQGRALVTRIDRVSRRFFQTDLISGIGRTGRCDPLNAPRF